MSEDTGNAVQVKKRRSKAKLAADQRDDFYRAVVNTVEGRAVFWDILEMCGMYRDCTPGTEAEMAHFLGRRNIGLKVVTQLLTVDANSYNTMQSEAHDRQRN